MNPKPLPAELSMRPATVEDVGIILELIREIAAYEKLSHQVTAEASTLKDSLFGPSPAAEVVLASWSGEVVGYAIYFHNFSTFEGKRGLYLEDIFIKPNHRGKGIGKAMLTHLAKLALERGCARFEWVVLDWNTPAIEFYQGLGASVLEDWKVCRMERESIEQLASGED